MRTSQLISFRPRAYSAEAQALNDQGTVEVDAALLAAYDEAPTDDPEYA